MSFDQIHKQNTFTQFFQCIKWYTRQNHQQQEVKVFITSNPIKIIELLNLLYQITFHTHIKYQSFFLVFQSWSFDLLIYFLIYFLLFIIYFINIQELKKKINQFFFHLKFYQYHYSRPYASYYIFQLYFFLFQQQYIPIFQFAHDKTLGLYKSYQTALKSFESGGAFLFLFSSIWHTYPSSGNIFGCCKYFEIIACEKFQQYSRGGIYGNLSVNYSLNFIILFQYGVPALPFIYRCLF